jgi:hypothetical protein
MKAAALTLACLAAALCITTSAQAKTPYSLEVLAGTQYNIPTPLTIHQNGEDPIRVGSARYKSDAWTWPDSPYYAWRIASWKDGRAWELELIHEKIILKNTPDEVQHFEVSHGYNLITINRAWPWPKDPRWILRVGGGVVVTHPETTVRGKSKGFGESFPNGFYISGPTAQASAARQFEIDDKWFFVLEAKLTASYATGVPIADGDAEVPNAAIHVLFGFGRRL